MLVVIRCRIIHFLTTISTINYARKHTDNSCFVRSAFIFSQFLNKIKDFLINNSRVGILKHLPFFFWIIYSDFAFKRFFTCSEIDCITNIFLLFKYSCNCIATPIKWFYRWLTASSAYANPILTGCHNFSGF